MYDKFGICECEEKINDRENWKRERKTTINETNVNKTEDKNHSRSQYKCRMERANEQTKGNWNYKQCVCVFEHYHLYATHATRWNEAKTNYNKTSIARGMEPSMAYVAYVRLSVMFLSNDRIGL